MNTSSTTDHAAAGSAAGYLYQCQSALLELLRRAPQQPDTVVFLEQIDDIHLERSGDPIEILQVKRHAGSAGDLTNMSVDLWRTIAIWMDVSSQLAPGERPILTLFTTGRAPAGSAAALLRDNSDRDEAGALALLEQAAATSTNAQTEQARLSFIRLSPADRRALLAAVVVRDEQPQISDFYGELEKLLPYLFRPQHRDAFLEALTGWWYRQCVRLLTDRQPGVAGSDLTSFIHELRDRLEPGDLPPPLTGPDPTAEELKQYAGRTFVAQMQWIAYSQEQLADAIRDFHRAYAERSRWLRLGLLEVGDLEHYERRLFDLWRREFNDMVRELRESTSEEDANERAGRLLLQQLRRQDQVRVRPRYSEEFLTHGTLHELADRSRAHAEQIGWHPDFRARLEQLLKAATS
jgi:hypothetical protein